MGRWGMVGLGRGIFWVVVSGWKCIFGEWGWVGVSEGDHFF